MGHRCTTSKATTEASGLKLKLDTESLGEYVNDYSTDGLRPVVTSRASLTNER